MEHADEDEWGLDELDHDIASSEYPSQQSQHSLCVNTRAYSSFTFPPKFTVELPKKMRTTTQPATQVTDLTLSEHEQ